MLVIVLAALVPLLGRWRKRKILERTGTPNLSFTNEAPAPTKTSRNHAKLLRRSESNSDGDVEERPFRTEKPGKADVNSAFSSKGSQLSTLTSPTAISWKVELTTSPV